ncbi:MAG TPA: AarF/UbiB family protein, partial [Mycobacterium sp.]|nr:AarF/UbiB family protein [Mycobacterium sp.]
MDDGRVSEIKRGRAARNAKLASLPVGFAGRAALGLGRRLTGSSKDEVTAELMEKAADQLFTVLGELKGGAMKVGQALSVIEAAVPEQFAAPYREALTKLQREAPPLPADKVHRVLDSQLGTKWRERFTSFDDDPVASASIGQVHKAVWSDGREVAVKIQYPGADGALRADLKTMKRMVSVFKQLAPGVDIQGVVDELIERTEMELDYRLEADNQRAFAKAYRDDPHFVVPAIVASSPKVVIAEWIEGIPMSQIIRSGTQEQRDLLGTRLFELTHDAPRRLELMHGDPHPGNFMLMPGGKMGVIDFGAVAPLPGGLPIELGYALRYGAAKDYDNLLTTMERVGFIQKGEQVSTRELDEMLRQYVEPISV